MSEYNETLTFFEKEANRSVSITDWQQARTFFTESTYKEWIYLIRFTDSIYAWGTASGNGDRLKKSGLLQRKVTGKYDRRVDYQMLKLIYGAPTITLFEMPDNAVAIEQCRRGQIYDGTTKGPCMRGFVKHTRDSIAIEIYEKFKTSAHYVAQTAADKNTFDEFVIKYWLGKLRHPHRNASFYYGDVLEPGFLGRTLERPDLVPVIERMLQIDC